jgi:hypothetical protein
MSTLLGLLVLAYVALLLTDDGHGYDSLREQLWASRGD